MYIINHNSGYSRHITGLGVAQITALIFPDDDKVVLASQNNLSDQP